MTTSATRGDAVVGYIDPIGMYAFVAIIFAAVVLIVSGLGKAASAVSGKNRPSAPNPPAVNTGCIVVVVAFAPLVFVLLTGAYNNRSLPRPEATASTGVSLSQSEPLVMMDIVLTLSGGVSDQYSQLRIRNKQTLNGDLSRRDVALTLLPNNIGSLTTDWVQLGCTDCTLVFPMAVSITPVEPTSGTISFEVAHDWLWDPYDPEVAESSLPEVAVSIVPSGQDLRRLGVGFANADSLLTPARPIDLFLARTTADPELLAGGFANAWPTVQATAAAFVPDDPNETLEIYRAYGYAASEDCRTVLCPNNDYVLVVRPKWGYEEVWELATAIPGTVSAAHWIDTTDQQLPDGGPSEVTLLPVEPNAWFEEHLTEEFDLNTNAAKVTVDINITGIPDYAVGAGVGMIQLIGQADAIRGTYSQRFFSLEGCTPCSFTVSNQTSVGTLHIDAFYGFFDTETVPPGVEIDFVTTWE